MSENAIKLTIIQFQINKYIKKRFRFFRVSRDLNTDVLKVVTKAFISVGSTMFADISIGRFINLTKLCHQMISIFGRKFPTLGPYYDPCIGLWKGIFWQSRAPKFLNTIVSKAQFPKNSGCGTGLPFFL